LWGRVTGRLLMTETKKMLVLIVEDMVDSAGIVASLLDRLGHSSHHVRDGHQALQYLDEHTPDLMILDIGLPGMNGWTLLEIMRTRYKTIPYRIIALTAFDDPANKLIGKFNQLVYRYLTKPFKPSMLAEVIRVALTEPEEDPEA
jgi:CheY-like chemotaxis protein